ncbi:phosphatase PAP2 family protein [Gordonia jinhuaensis]|uniref:Phosphoesterase n=1 Tax=Gordonia jinhuaensis TaxID=1517702 RepID=A0A916WY75_9ACTN|nr:phosphatase PAP2 family protein [Gordonia jinhuaensis]GGB41693.1 putative phosphoesterase [Gordonia jinhuaensis]
MSSESTDLDSTGADALGEPTGEVKILLGIQRALADKPGVLATARGLSHFGEHSLGWIAVSAVGALASRDADRRRMWVEVGVGAFGAHAASVIIKRIVRRPRPHDPRIVVGVSTPSKLSFPSSHATSTTAAALLIERAADTPRGLVPAVLVPPMVVSRLVLGVHYPTDVAAGAGLGAVAAKVVIEGDKMLRRRYGVRWPAVVAGPVLRKLSRGRTT